MAQELIDIQTGVNADGGPAATPTLFTPVFAHMLEPGDWFTYRVIRYANQPHRVVLSHPELVAITEDDARVWAGNLTDADRLMVAFRRSHPRYAYAACRLPANLSVLRAVGARAQGGGAR